MNIFRKARQGLLTYVNQEIVPFFGKIYNKKNKYVNVIYYHDIVEDGGDSYMRTNKKVFIQQMFWLAANNYETLRFDDLDEEHLKFREGKILIAFDDGWLSNYTEIFELMKGLGLKYNIFLTMGEIGKNPDYLTWDMVREMHKSGLCGFGAHTFTHPDMSVLSKVDFHHEVYDADALFKQELGFAPVDFCYPFGYYSEESNVKLEKDSNYKHIYTSRMMYSYKQNGCVVFGRNGISNDYPKRYFCKKVKGYANWNKIYNDHFYCHVLNLYHLIKNRKV